MTYLILFILLSFVLLTISIAMALQNNRSLIKQKSNSAFCVTLRSEIGVTTLKVEIGKLIYLDFAILEKKQALNSKYDGWSVKIQFQIRIF
jgi:ABC-type enterochelin transport system substrate-binding protein